MLQLHFGLGNHISKESTSSLHTARLLAWIANPVYILTIYCSMLAMSLLIARITRSASQVWLARGTIVATTAWGITAAFVLTFRCSLPTPWLAPTGKACLNAVRRLDHDTAHCS